ncbi:MAG: hypothetical protein HQL95_09690 [Magnetococcales bacterium]|nr:hypothetical protein [Magnetococcales bacterium]
MKTTCNSKSIQTTSMIQNAEFPPSARQTPLKTLDAVSDLLAKSPFLLGRRGLGLNVFPTREITR